MNCLLLITREDAPYLKKFGQLLDPNGNHTAMSADSIVMANLDVVASEYDVVLTTSARVCTVIFGKKFKDGDAQGSGENVYNYIGTIVKREKEFLVIPPLKRLYSTSSGEFLAKRYLSKIFQPEKWMKLPEFKWQVVSNPDEFLSAVSKCKAAAIDIEVNTKIYCIGFGLLMEDFSIENYVLPLTCEFDLVIAKKALTSDCQKVFQNGRYDVTHLLTYGLPVRNWLWDTLGMMHSWYSELPRRLDFIASFMLRDAQYWKNEKNSDTLYDKYQYNAKDTYHTMCAFLAWIEEAPDWAKKNYLITFPELFPMIHCSLEGIKVDIEKRNIIVKEQTEIIEKNMDDIRVALNRPDFNVNSPKQLGELCKFLKVKNFIATDSKSLQKYTVGNPLMAWFVPRIIKYKKATKLLSTYLNTKLYGDRLLYSLNPFGTDTGRTASNESNLFEFSRSKTGLPVFEHYGTQIQNIPPYAKTMLKADDGWRLFEIDKKSSESWCTAALSREPKLWAALTDNEDFHCANASIFFGIPYDQLYKDGKVLNKDIRTLSKRINHGANYNMQENMLVEVMGEEYLFEAKRLLGLRQRTAKDIAAYLLRLFDKGYPRIRGAWQQEIKIEVMTTHMLSSPSGWTRYCFGNPTDNKLDLNAYIAHGPQHLSVKLINKALIAIWRELALPLGSDIRLKAQVHDSILGQYRIGREDILDKVEKMMRVKVKVFDKELCIPNDVSTGEYWK